MGDPLQIRIGRDLAWSFGPLLNEAGEALDMSSAASTGEWFVLTRRGDPDSAVLHLNEALGSVTFLSQVVGGVTQYTMLVTIQPSDTAAILPGLYFHEPVVADATGHIYSLETDDGNLIQLKAAVPFAVPA
jgi:hypothetical protein